MNHEMVTDATGQLINQGEGQEQSEITVANATDQILGISPNMLWFDSFDTTMSLFPIVDTHVMGNDLT